MSKTEWDLIKGKISVLSTCCCSEKKKIIIQTFYNFYQTFSRSGIFLCKFQGFSKNSKNSRLCMNPLNWYPKKRFTFRHILDPPGQPIISKLVPDMLSISVHWNKSRNNGGSDILDHRIRLLDAENKKEQVYQGIRNNYFSLRNLRQNRTYVIVLQSRNVIGYGKEKNVTVSTLEGGKLKYFLLVLLQFYVISFIPFFNRSIVDYIKHSINAQSIHQTIRLSLLISQGTYMIFLLSFSLSSLETI